MDQTIQNKDVIKDNMVFVPRGTFLMGSQNFYPEERPMRKVTVDGF